ncbi:MAG: hypothetical protein IPI58_00220 [Alphaproteobacteria bacterium]|nr:MAG: hypothetical protein IPI58_00220 [Alphaproteobacteria bacterium]
MYLLKPHILALMSLMLVLISCTGTEPTQTYESKFRKPEAAVVPTKEQNVRGADNPPVVTLQIGKALRERMMDRADRLPATAVIGSTNLNSVPIAAALQAVLAGTDVSLSWPSGEFNDRTVTIFNLSGNLPHVVDKICQAAKVYCSYRQGTLEIKDRETFIIELPPVAVNPESSGNAVSNTIADAIGSLTDKEVKVDSAGGYLIYTADSEQQQRVKEYLTELRQGRPLVVLQLYVWEVVLDDSRQRGINWDNLKIKAFQTFGDDTVALSASSALSKVQSGVNFGAVFGGKFSAEFLAQFLGTQGTVQTISNPQMTFVSGSSAEFKIGGTRHYVSQVGQLVTNSVSGSSGSNVGQNTVQTDKVETGLTIKANGSYEGGVVFASLNLNLTNLVALREIRNGETTLQLPETSDRKISTVLRVRPGDNLVLAGITSSRDESGRDGLMAPVLGVLPFHANNIIQNNEMVILVRPSVVFFSDEQPKLEEVSPVAQEIKPVAASSPHSTQSLVSGQKLQDGFASSWSRIESAAARRSL